MILHLVEPHPIIRGLSPWVFHRFRNMLRQVRKFTTGRRLLNEIEIKIMPIARPNEATDTKRARLLYQSRKRGILESDLLLSKFADMYLKDMDRKQLDEYDLLLDEQDWDIYYWASRAQGAPKCPERWENTEVMQRLRKIAKNEEREVMRMPDLK